MFKRMLHNKVGIFFAPASYLIAFDTTPPPPPAPSLLLPLGPCPHPCKGGWPIMWSVPKPGTEGLMYSAMEWHRHISGGWYLALGGDADVFHCPPSSFRRCKVQGGLYCLYQTILCWCCSYHWLNWRALLPHAGPLSCSFVCQ